MGDLALVSHKERGQPALVSIIEKIQLALKFTFTLYQQYDRWYTKEREE